MLIAAVLVWAFHRSTRRKQARLARDAEQSQALLERLSVATQAAGIYCWELDWKTYAITWDKSRLPAAEAAAASAAAFQWRTGQ